MVDRIIVPVDGSQLSHAALPLARGLAATTGAAVTLLTVMDPPRDFYLVAQDSSQTRFSPKDIDRLSDENTRLEEYLTKIAGTFEGSRVATEVRLGSPVEEILDEAESARDSVVVMASHGRTGLGRALIGSVASRVVQGASVPVFVIRASEDSREEYGKSEINQVVVPLDGSLLAEQALAAVHRVFGNSVIVHMVRAVEPVSMGHAYAPGTVAEYERTARSEAEQYLERMAEELREKGVTVTWEIRGESPVDGIKETAEQAGADIIAMTTHGRSGMGRFMLGSVAERVLQNSPCPVMMIRAAEREEDSNDDSPPFV